MGEISAEPVAFDASDPTDIPNAVASLPDDIGVLVNKAGGNANIGAEDPGNDLAAVASAWRANLDANLLSAVLVTTAMAPRLTDDARIVTMSSIGARTGAGSYGAAKAAIEAWTADISREFGSRGITANVVSPGLVMETEFFGGTLTDDKITRLVDATRNGRSGHPDDIASTVAFLASPEAGHLTGQVIHVNGGAYLGL